MFHNVMYTKQKHPTMQLSYYRRKNLDREREREVDAKKAVLLRVAWFKKSDIKHFEKSHIKCSKKCTDFSLSWVKTGLNN